MKPVLTIAFLTGRSTPGRCALSPEQAAFFNRLDGPGRALAPDNFPYAASEPFRATSLLRASWQNLREYFASRDEQFARRHEATVTALIERKPHTVFLAGSCGLELFNNLRLPAELERRCTLIAYGPIARRLPRHAACHLVQGSRDWLTRRWFPGREPELACNHLGYLGDPAFLRLCQTHLARLSPVPCSSTSA